MPHCFVYKGPVPDAVQAAFKNHLRQSNDIYIYIHIYIYIYIASVLFIHTCILSLKQKVIDGGTADGTYELGIDASICSRMNWDSALVIKTHLVVD
jgi:hypothetical protein